LERADQIIFWRNGVGIDAHIFQNLGLRPVFKMKRGECQRAGAFVFPVDEYIIGPETAQVSTEIWTAAISGMCRQLL
jgi:hypothetical protein